MTLDLYDDGQDIPTLSEALGGQRNNVLPKDRASVTLMSGEGTGALVRIGDNDVVFGRDGDAGAQFEEASLSRRHARFFCVKREVYVQDLGSRTGTFVCGKLIDGPCRLADGDQIGLGPDRLLRFNLYDIHEEEAALQLYELCIVDATSGAYNRRHFDERLEAERLFAIRGSKPIALLLLDIDEFKQVNDTRGHVVGDVVLRVLSANVQRLLRPSDSLARFGGDEFAVLCRDTSLRNGLILAERIRSSIERLPFCTGGNDFNITVSIGVAGIPGGAQGSLLADADAALHRAKLHGKNSVAPGSTARLHAHPSLRPC